MWINLNWNGSASACRIWAIVTLHLTGTSLSRPLSHYPYYTLLIAAILHLGAFMASQSVSLSSIDDSSSDSFASSNSSSVADQTSSEILAASSIESTSNEPSSSLSFSCSSSPQISVCIDAQASSQTALHSLDAQTKPSHSRAPAIVGAIFAVLIVLIAILVFFIYRRRRLNRRNNINEMLYQQHPDPFMWKRIEAGVHQEEDPDHSDSAWSVESGGWAELRVPTVSTVPTLTPTPRQQGSIVPGTVMPLRRLRQSTSTNTLASKPPHYTVRSHAVSVGDLAWEDREASDDTHSDPPAEFRVVSPICTAPIAPPRRRGYKVSELYTSLRERQRSKSTNALSANAQPPHDAIRSHSQLGVRDVYGFGQDLASGLYTSLRERQRSKSTNALSANAQPPHDAIRSHSQLGVRDVYGFGQDLASGLYTSLRGRQRSKSTDALSAQPPPHDTIRSHSQLGVRDVYGFGQDLASGLYTSLRGRQRSKSTDALSAKPKLPHYTLRSPSLVSVDEVYGFGQRLVSQEALYEEVVLIAGAAATAPHTAIGMVPLTPWSQAGHSNDDHDWPATATPLQRFPSSVSSVSVSSLPSVYSARTINPPPALVSRTTEIPEDYDRPATATPHLLQRFPSSVSVSSMPSVYSAPAMDPPPALVVRTTDIPEVLLDDATHSARMYSLAW